MITYRAATLADCPALAALKREVWETTYRGIYPDEKLDGYVLQEHQEIFESLVTDPEELLMLACDGERIVGYMCCGKPRRPFWDYEQDIGLLYIHKDYQRLGIGKAFFEMGRDRIRANGYDRFFIAVNKYNTNAQRFYLAMGGSIVHIDPDREDHSTVQMKVHYTI